MYICMYIYICIYIYICWSFNEWIWGFKQPFCREINEEQMRKIMQKLYTIGVYHIYSNFRKRMPNRSPLSDKNEGCNWDIAQHKWEPYPRRPIVLLYICVYVYMCIYTYVYMCINTVYGLSTPLMQVSRWLFKPRCFWGPLCPFRPFPLRPGMGQGHCCVVKDWGNQHVSMDTCE